MKSSGELVKGSINDHLELMMIKISSLSLIEDLSRRSMGAGVDLARSTLGAHLELPRS